MQPVRVSWLPRSIFTCLLFLCDKSQSFLKTKPLITVHKVPQTQTTTLKLHLWLSCWCLWTPFVIDWTPLSFYQHTLSLSLSNVTSLSHGCTCVCRGFEWLKTPTKAGIVFVTVSLLVKFMQESSLICWICLHV